jgi:hypothetical protein
MNDDTVGASLMAVKRQTQSQPTGAFAVAVNENCRESKVLQGNLRE